LDKVIEISELKKDYNGFAALDGISLDVLDNEIFGMVGPDGAGKTTTIRILCGLLHPTSGSVKIFGNDLIKKKKLIKSQIGYLSQKFSLYVDLTVDENISFISKIHGVKDFKKRRDELLDFMRLTAFRKFLAGKLSGGMKQKLALACALIHRPRILFLDEPTTGVDPVSRRDFWKILSNLLQEKLTIVISTPYLDEAERFNRIVMLNNGKILKYGTPKDIKSEMHNEIIEIVCPEIRKAFEVVKSETQFEVQMFGDRIDIAVNSYEKDIDTIKNLFKSHSIPVEDYRLKPVSLENVFIKILKEIAV
jgi:ABC-2 type transport system ATP-binding protein